MNRVYVYALTGGGARPFRSGAHRIQFVSVGGIHAAVERRTSAPAVSEAALQDQHAVVADIARRVDAMLPTRFGALVDRPELDSIVRQRAAVIEEALALVAGREQMTVRLIGEQDPETLPIHPPRSGTEYLQRRRAAPSGPYADFVASMQRAVRTLVAASRVEPGQGRVRTSVYHLIARGKSGAYRDALSTVPLPSGRPFEVSVSGPWPPFAFAPPILRTTTEA